MPRGKRSDNAQTTKAAAKTKTKKSDMVWGGYLNLRLTEEQKDQFEQYMLERAAEVCDRTDELLVVGFKISITFDAENDSYIASLTGALLPSMPDTLFCATARAETLARSWLLLVFKHFEIADGDWDDYLPRTNSLRRFE